MPLDTWFKAGTSAAALVLAMAGAATAAPAPLPRVNRPPRRRQR